VYWHRYRPLPTISVVHSWGCSVRRELGNRACTLDWPGSMASSCPCLPCVLLRQVGLLSRGISGYYPSHTPQTPALVSRELGDSRRALACPGVAMCLAGPSRSLQVVRRAALTSCHQAGSECVVRYGGRWSALRDSGGLRPGRIQRPVSRTRSGDSAEEYSGRSRRWHHPWRGASVAPPPIFSPRRRAPCAATGLREHQERTVTSGRCAQLSTLASPDGGGRDLRTTAAGSERRVEQRRR
jgi:hypothetical protein